MKPRFLADCNVGRLARWLRALGYDASYHARIGDAEGARKTYERAAQVVPDSVDAFVGVAVSTAALGECAPSRAALARARAFAAQQQRTIDAVGAGYAADVRAALAHCNG